MRNLFLDKSLNFKKIAGMEIRLSDDVEKWPMECASYLHKSLPFLTNFAVNISLENTDAERGYAYGMAKIKNKYEVQKNDGREITIPIIIKERMLKPFDIFMKGDKAEPLSEDALSQSLFVASPMELSERKPQERDISNQYMPPTDRWNSYGNIRGRGPGYTSTEGAYKMASMLDKINVSKEYVDYLSTKIANSMELKTALYNNPYFLNAVGKIASNVSEENTKELNIEPTVIQFKKLARNLVQIKWANNKYYKPEVDTVSIKEASLFIGDSIYDLPTNEYITLVLDPAKETKNDYYEPIKEAGYYECIDHKGSILNGNVIKVSNFNGGESFLFISRDGYCLQDEIVGKKIDTIKEANYQGPTNFGIFISEGYISEPIKISHQINGNFIAKNSFNMNLSIAPTSYIKTAAIVGQNEFLIPEDSNFMLIPEKEICLKNNIEDINKLASLKNYDSTVRICKLANDLYSIDGVPTKKLNGDYNKENIDFILGACGIESQKTANININEYKFLTGNPITLLEDVKEEIEKKASTLINSTLDLSIDLIKEAAAIPDQDTVDTILSLGMITPDTIIKFINSIPKLQDTANNLADFLLHVRLGLSNIPEEAVESAMKNLLLIIKNLKILKETNL